METNQTHNFPQELHGYVLGRHLDSDGGAKLFSAQVRATGQAVALKTFVKSDLTSEDRCERINSEVDIHVNLCHSHILKFYTAFEDDDAVYLVTELAQTNLLSYIQLNRLSEGRIRRLFTQIIKATEYVHSKNLVHRDLKLPNILMNGDGIKLAGFGHARYIGAGMIPDITMCDDANYLSPEILAEKVVGQAADMWALGCILLCLFTGKHPFKTSQNHRSNLAMGYELPTSLSVEVRDLLARLLEGDQRKRITAQQALEHSWIAQKTLPRIVLRQSKIAPKVVPTLSAVSANVQKPQLPTLPYDNFQGLKPSPTLSRWLNTGLSKPQLQFSDMEAPADMLALEELSPKLQEILQSHKPISSSLFSKQATRPTPRTQITTPTSIVTSKPYGRNRIVSNSCSDFAKKYRFSTKHLRFIQQETKHGSAVISEDGLRLSFPRDNNAFHISSDGESVEVNDGNGSHTFSLDDLPVRYLNIYRYGSRFVSLVRSKTCNAAIESGDIRARLFLDNHFDMMHNKHRVIIHDLMTQVWVDGQLQWKGVHPPDSYRGLVSTAKQWNEKLSRAYECCQTKFVPGFGWMESWGMWRRFLFLDGVQLDVYKDTLARNPLESGLQNVQVRLHEIKRGFGVDVKMPDVE